MFELSDPLDYEVRQSFRLAEHENEGRRVSLSQLR
jgi:hypothetical protein